MWMLKYLALLLAVRAPAPSTIPLSGNDEKIQKRRYFSSKVIGKSTDDRMLVKAVNSKGISGFYWETGKQEGYEASLPKKYLGRFKLLITHYFRDVEITYSNPLSFFFGRVTFRHRRVLYWARFRRWMFGIRSLEEASQIEVLKWCQQKAVYDRENELSHWGFLSEKHGINWIHHAQKDSLLSYYKWIMDSLCASGDLKQAGTSRYRLEPKAISTIIKYDVDLRRDLDSKNQQRRMAGLTKALVLVAFVQTIVAIVAIWVNYTATSGV